MYEDFRREGKFKTHFHKTNSFPFFKEGMANASKFTLSKKESFILPHSGRFFSKRHAVSSIVHTPYGQVRVLNVHLSPFAKNYDKRVNQIAFLAKLIKQRYSNENIVILGDFNQPFQQKFYKPLLDLGFQNTIAHNTCTYCASNPYIDSNVGVKLDYIFYLPKKMQLLDSQLIFKDYPISDHYGVMGTFKILN